VLLAWLMVKLIEIGNQKLWLWVGALIGITVLNKYGVLFFVCGLLLGVRLTPLRIHLVRPWFGWARRWTLIALPTFCGKEAALSIQCSVVVNIRSGARVM